MTLDEVGLADVKDLASRRDRHSVSIWMPAHRGSREVRQDPMRFKNLVRDAERRLEAAGLSPDEARAYLEPAWDLQGDLDFWRRQAESLVYYRSGSLSRPVRLPIRVPERVVVTDRFQVRPLMAVLEGNGTFYALALSRSSVRLLKGTRWAMREVAIPGLPEPFPGDAWRAGGEGTTFRGEATAPASRRGAAAPGEIARGSKTQHGQGVGTDDFRNARTRQWFHLLQRQVVAALDDPNAPLVVIGDEHVVPGFLEACRYPGLVREFIPRHPGGMTDDHLRIAAFELVGPVLRARLDRALDEYRDLSARGRLASDVIDEVLAAAGRGRVLWLFVDETSSRFGRIDPATGAATLHEPPLPDDDDLVDLAAAEGLVRGATVFVLPRDLMPTPAPVAAVFRY